MNAPSHAPEYTGYLYLEAVNIGAVIDDTEDLSTRRAGGYMLLELVHDVARHCKALLAPISIGASRGLFGLKPDADLAAARREVMCVLNQPLFAQATVVIADSSEFRVNAVAGMTAFQATQEALQALVRRRQMQRLSMATNFQSSPTDEAGRAPVCMTDGIRPSAVQEPFKGEEPRWHSHSLSTRRDAGIGLRQRFYQRELGRSGDHDNDTGGLKFTDTFEQLSAFTNGQAARMTTPLLDRKMAVFYADGNGFGKRARACASPQVLHCWDERVQHARRSFLSALLEFLASDVDGRRHDKGPDVQTPTGQLRVETLMWGGDELLLVLPAWLALAAADLFFRTCRIQDHDGQMCSHAVALVFAHHNAPIARLQRLAKHGVAELGKRAGLRQRDSLNWVVLESFDHAGQDVSDYWKQRGLTDAPALESIALAPEGLRTLLAEVPRLRSALPKRNLYRIVQGLQPDAPDGADDRRLLQRAYENLHQALVEAELLARWQAMWKALRPHDEPWPDAASPSPDRAHLGAWLTISELWDYLPPALVEVEPIAAAEQTRASS